jgi:hypothetical protein
LNELNARLTELVAATWSQLTEFPVVHYQEWTAGCFSPSVDRCKVCNREQHLISLYALLKKQATPGAAFLRDKSALRVDSAKANLLRVPIVSVYSPSHGPRGLEPGNKASSLRWKRFLRIAPRSHLYAVLACAPLLLFLASASLPAQQRTWIF